MQKPMQREKNEFGSSMVNPDETMDQLEMQLNRLHRSIRLTIERHLQALSGTRYESLEQNQTAAAKIGKLLDRYGLRMQCTECGTPSILRVSARKNATTGVFVFDHVVNGKRTFHGGKSVFPPMDLTEKPPRKTNR
jgi:hypothetical protein